MTDKSDKPSVSKEKKEEPVSQEEEKKKLSSDFNYKDIHIEVAALRAMLEKKKRTDR